MLTSSDAKWRCMWHMLIWSVVMTLVSQFYDILDFLAYFFFAAVTVIFLPVLTAIYSNTSGRRGSTLIRFGYVFCDPVLACLTVLPTLVMNHLPGILDEYHCLVNHVNRNDTLHCLENKTQPEDYQRYASIKPWDYQFLITTKQNDFLQVQISIVAPILLALSMGRRTSKMRYNTQLLIFAYWFIASLDAIELLETAMLSKAYKHVIFTTETIVSVALIISNSYAIVTLCSYLTPSNELNAIHEGAAYSRTFDFVYKALISSLAIFFCEIPILVARLQILFTEVNRTVYGTFVLWIIKNLMFIAMIFLTVFFPKLRKHLQKQMSRVSCQPNLFDGDKAFFKPEKRDVYIYTHQVNAVRKSALKKDKKVVVQEDALSKEPKKVTFQMDFKSPVQLSTIEEEQEPSSPV